jgi:hypothetical protein
VLIVNGVADAHGAGQMCQYHGIKYSHHMWQYPLERYMTYTYMSLNIYIPSDAGCLECSAKTKEYGGLCGTGLIRTGVATARRPTQLLFILSEIGEQ